ncbi:TolC family outer membrane protein [Palleronia caenipelagi]|uniref:TolC family outer membrane protein n=1 Tax=Palleronia caenipelagi TaxID=2489174 RepID=A0A547PY37_9RHOB|nr:TolC family outer membrane protein [Palleronia caenipelagi]TRD19034.1 TolC family outer membrane protein [Palleronia caenipelagi]
MTLRRFAILGATALTLSVSSGVARAETIADALVLAYRHSGLLEKNRAVLRAADEGVAQAISTLRPVIDYAVSAQRTWVFPNDESALRGPAGNVIIPKIENESFDSASAEITASLLLYDGGASQLAIDAAKETVLATRHALVQVEQQVLLSAASAYLDVREAIAFVNLRETSLNLTREQLRASRQRFEVGENTRTDVALAEADEAAARSQLAASRGDLEIAISRYVEAVGKKPGTLQPARKQQPATASSLEAAQKVARQTHPRILADMREITIGELNVLRAEAAIRPTVRLQGRLAMDEDYQETADIGIRMSGPLYRGGQITSAYRQAVARRDEARGDLHVTTDNVLQVASQAWAQREVAQARIRAGQLEVRAAQVAYDGISEELQLGARTTLDLLDARQDLESAKANLISAQIGEVRASYGLLFSMGLLTVKQLGLGVTTYDPAAYYNAVKDAPGRKVSPQGEKLDSLLKSLVR